MGAAEHGEALGALGREAEEAPVDVAVIGGGAAGLYTALEAADRGASVVLISRKPLSESASFWAQGGLAAAIAADDSPELHAEDTIRAGRAACRRSAVELLARDAPAAVADLERRGVEFDRDPDDGALALGLEGGHSRRRIVHAGGAGTGRRITERLAELAADHDRIEVREGASATALWSDGESCSGVVTDQGNVVATATVLATGGAAALWQRTTNPWGAIGAGLVLAHAAGAELADLELCQFHPTALAKPGEHDGLLITEAVRGEGATLLDRDGKRFTNELAPRDEVTLAILDRLEATSGSHVFLDMRAIEETSFPSVFDALRRAGVDAAAELIPVAPAAHYVMGGIACDLDGRSSLPGLYAVGECSCTGLHGANRLASNSLSECFVLGARVGAAVESDSGATKPPPVPQWQFEPPKEATRAAVWRWAGPRRSEDALRELLDDPYPLAAMVARSALERRESRGSHVRVEFPRPDPALDRNHLVVDASGGIHFARWD